MSHHEEGTLRPEDVQETSEITEETKSDELTEEDLENVAGGATDESSALHDDIRES